MSEFPDVAEKALPFACEQTTVLFSSPFCPPDIFHLSCLLCLLLHIVTYFFHVVLTFFILFRFICDILLLNEVNVESGYPSLCVLFSPSQRDPLALFVGPEASWKSLQHLARRRLQGLFRGTAPLKQLHLYSCSRKRTPQMAAQACSNSSKCKHFCQWLYRLIVRTHLFWSLNQIDFMFLRGICKYMEYVKYVNEISLNGMDIKGRVNIFPPKQCSVLPLLLVLDGPKYLSKNINQLHNSAVTVWNQCLCSKQEFWLQTPDFISWKKKVIKWGRNDHFSSKTHCERDELLAVVYSPLISLQNSTSKQLKKQILLYC